MCYFLCCLFISSLNSLNPCRSSLESLCWKDCARPPICLASFWIFPPTCLASFWRRYWISDFWILSTASSPRNKSHSNGLVTNQKIIPLAHCKNSRYCQMSNIRCTKSHNVDISRLPCLPVVIAQSIETRCKVDNEDLVGAAPVGAVPTTSEW